MTGSNGGRALRAWVSYFTTNILIVLRNDRMYIYNPERRDDALSEHLASESYQVRFTSEQLKKNSSGLFFYVLRMNGRESKSRAMVVRE